MQSPELVVARYLENLNWLRNLPAGIRQTIYDKSPDGSAGDAAIPLPNTGREAHTYLHHIVTRYESLADWTIFCQGKPFDHAYDFKKTMRAMTERSEADGPVRPAFSTTSAFAWLGHLIDTDDDQGERLFRPWSKNDDGRGLAMRGFHQALFGNNGPERYTFVLGAQFVIHRTLICRRPRVFYERALVVAATFPDAAHCFERSWDRVFGVTGIDTDWLAGRQTAQLKPMKHQSPTE